MRIIVLMVVSSYLFSCITATHIILVQLTNSKLLLCMHNLDDLNVSMSSLMVAGVHFMGPT